MPAGLSDTFCWFQITVEVLVNDHLQELQKVVATRSGRLRELILESDHPCSEMAKVGRLRETVTLYCYVYF